MDKHIHIHVGVKTKDAVSQEDELKFQKCTAAIRSVEVLLKSLQQVQASLKSGKGSVMSAEAFDEVKAKVREAGYKVN